MPNFRFYHFRFLGSTNDKAKAFSKRGRSNLVIIADRQAKGRGRFNRKWNSDLGGLYMTILLKEKNLDMVRYFTLIASIAVAKTIRETTKLNAELKWPNDILVNGKKVCGILTETTYGKENYALVGIGVNINQKKFPRGIINKATSLTIETNNQFNIKNISKEIIKAFNVLYAYYKNKNYKKILDLWKKHSHTLGKKVKAKTLSGTFIGKAIDVDNNYNLILKLKNGKLKKIVEGDIFVV